MVVILYCLFYSDSNLLGLIASNLHNTLVFRLPLCLSSIIDRHLCCCRLLPRVLVLCLSSVFCSVCKSERRNRGSNSLKLRPLTNILTITPREFSLVGGHRQGKWNRQSIPIKVFRGLFRLIIFTQTLRWGRI